MAAEPLQSEAKLSGGVVVPGGVGADICADAYEGAVAGLVSDGVVSGTAGVSVGDEPGTKAVRRVRRSYVQTCC